MNLEIKKKKNFYADFDTVEKLLKNSNENRQRQETDDHITVLKVS
jgi:hypothetical protein